METCILFSDPKDEKSNQWLTRVEAPRLFPSGDPIICAISHSQHSSISVGGTTSNNSEFSQDSTSLTIAKVDRRIIPSSGAVLGMIRRFVY